MLQRFESLSLDALACALPGRSKAVADFAGLFGEQQVTRFQQVAGVSSFPVAAPAQRTSDLAAAAAGELIATGALNPEEVDALLFVTQTPDAVAPATSALLQTRLGLRTGILALDINQGCAGFLVALQTAAHLLLHPAIRKVLILGGDTLSRVVDPDDPTAAMLFGDAGFAAVAGKSGTAPATFLTNTCSSEAIVIPHGKPFHMAGTEVFNFTITQVPEQIQALRCAVGLTDPALPDLLLLHQANAFIVRQIARMCRLPEERVPCRMENRGNTSSASLPLLLCDLAAEGRSGPCNAILSAFGVGLTRCSLHLSLDFDRFHAPITLQENV